MKRPPSESREQQVVETISIDADQVESLEEHFTPEYVVHGIHFGEGDPEADGQHWNFSRTLGDNDDGVCTVQEIQRVTVYGGIVRFSMTRNRIICEFELATAQKTLVRRLDIRYDVDAKTWKGLVEQAHHVFQGEPYFDLSG
jgi:hypothetical protein